MIGKNVGWKQAVNMGKRNNQAFVFLPHARFTELLIYKAELVGIQVVLAEESYTSKASFLDGDPLPVYGAVDSPPSTNTPTPIFSGKRVKRGMYRAADGRHINADVNGSYNILRKAFPNSFAQAVAQNMAQVKIHPIHLLLPDRRQDRRKQSRTLCATG